MYMGLQYIEESISERALDDSIMAGVEEDAMADAVDAQK
jgi:hypothetical protein